MRASQKSCGYTPDGFDPLAIDISVFTKGQLFRPSHYPNVTPQYLRALYSSTNLHTPPQAPNLYLPTPSQPTFLDTPSVLESAEFRTSLHVAKGNCELACEQALALRAKAFVANDPRCQDISSEQKAYCQGVAAALSVVALRFPKTHESTPLHARAAEESHFSIIKDAVIRSVDIGPSPDIVEKPVRFFITKPGEQLAILRPGQVEWDVLCDTLLELYLIIIPVFHVDSSR